MPHSEHLCSHINTIEDAHEGTIVCTDCGLVLSDQTFIQNDIQYNDFCSEKEEIKDMLERINIPRCYMSDIIKNVNKVEKNKKKIIPYIIYKTLNENDCQISINDISNTSGLNTKNIYKMQEENKSIILEPHKLAEKYCTLLGLNHKMYSVIKGKLEKTDGSGHNPLTVLGAHIHTYCKENKLSKSKKFRIKQIANTLNISCVSIQRYLRENDVSYRFETSTRSRIGELV